MERFAGRYALVRPLGQGGMGQVWLALDLTSGNECALKRLELRLPRSERDSLQSEFEVLTRVRHPAVVSVHELGFAPDGTPFYTMEHVPGLGADRALAGAGWDALQEFAARVTDGLEALHTAGIVHGDVKPSNLLVLPGATPRSAPSGVRLVDFGLSALLERDPKGHRGTPGFAAPEVVRGTPLSIASDLYGLGATLFVLALGATQTGDASLSPPVRPPHDANAAALALEGTGVPVGLAQLIVRLLASGPEARPASAREVRLELARLHPAARRSLDERLHTDLSVGRGRELARLERWLASAAGSSPVLLLSGASGMGKSTLLRELAVRASLAGRTVIALAGVASDVPGALGRRLLLRLAVAAEAVAGPLSPHGAVRARLEQSQALRESEIGALAEVALDWARVLSARDGRALLLLDDFERLDTLTRALVRRMVTVEDRAVLRWVWASATAFAGSDLAEQLLLETGIAEPLVLGTFERADADRLLAARLQSTPPTELADAVWQRCGGHPGLTVEVLRSALQAGALRETDSGLTLDRTALERLSLPEDFESLCLRRFAALAPGAAAAAAALAVWGMPVRPSDVAALEPAAEESALAALQDGGLLASTEDGRCTLNPPALARGVLATLAPDVRARMFRAALEHPDLSHATRFRLWSGAGDTARALAEAELGLAGGGDLRLAIDAAALAASEPPAESAAWDLRAGQMLLERGRYRDALPHLERATSRLAPGPERARAQCLLSSAYLRTGAMRQLEELLAEALAGPLPDRERALLLVNLGASRIAVGSVADARDSSLEALRLAEAAHDAEAEGLAHLSLASIAVHEGGQAARAEQHAKQSSAAFVRAGHELGRLRATVVSVHALWQQQKHAEAERICREALAEASARDLRLAMSEILRALALLLTESGSWSEARACEQQALRLAIEEGWPGFVATGVLAVMAWDALTGQPRRALRHARRMLKLVRRYQRFLEPNAFRIVAVALRNSGQPRRALRMFRRAVEAAERARSVFEILWARIECGQLLARQGRWTQAVEEWQAAWAESPRADSVPACVLAVSLARAALRRKDLASAAPVLAEVETWLAAHRAPYLQAHVLQLRAELAMLRGEPEAAAESATGALAAFDGLQAVADSAAAAVESARLAVASGLAARLPVNEWLHRAAASYDLVGDRRGRERALALAVDWYRRFSSGPPAVARERDLLKAVGQLLDSLSDFGQLTRAAMRLAVEQLDAERGVLLLAGEEPGADPEFADLHPVVEHGAVDVATRDQALSYSRQVVRRVRRSGGPLVIPDARSESEGLSHSVVELGLRSILCVPLFVESKVVGAVYLDDSRRASAFGDAERALLEGFAHLLAVAIVNSRGHEEVRRENEQLVGENLSLRREASVRFRPQNFISGSLAMRRVLATVERAAVTSSNVLITGENGTGKELIARMLHHSGPRALKPFVAVNCGAIAATLLESELFGILPDVATGVKARSGRFVEADGGTLFLDEIGDMPVQHQVALLRVLAEKSVTPVGGGRAIPVDVRIVAATNRDLPRGISENTFREDLWFRLNVIPIEMPTLRERKADIPSLAQHFAAVFAGQQEREVPTLSPGLIAVLMQSDWPGNVRELQNYIERLIAMTPGRILHPDPLPHDLQQRSQLAVRNERGRRLEDLVADLEKRHVLEALDRHAGNQTRAALDLGLTEQSLRYRLRKYALHSTRRFRRVR